MGARPKEVDGARGRASARSALAGLAAPLTVAALVALWQLVCSVGLVPSFLLPSPVAVVQALVADWPLLAGHAATSLAEAALGLGAGIALGFGAAVLMDRFELVYRAFYPLVVLTQTVPTVAIAPLLVLWFGYGILPKVVLIVVTTFFPITVGLLDGFRSVDPDAIDLMRSMGAGRAQIMRHAKLPASLPHFFSGLKISATYAIVGAVIAEWLGGFSGLGVYMTRVRSAYAFDKMFAVILLISAMSLALMWAVGMIRRAVMPWERAAGRDER
ncbi:ABC transporter permease [Candidatus Collinsella stercoripullorum]|uniref:ABC transporter permease n=1 Tax=Candidatus Collinsella stercoripullorum TaxID=2838522 RepID=UPI0022E878B3|nr:ABC transporter permease [Candidatus Collinsella stercoripullorum]